MATDSAGADYVVDGGNHRVQKFAPADGHMAMFGITSQPGSANGQFQFPSGVAVDSLGNVYVADTDNDRIQKFKPAQ